VAGHVAQKQLVNLRRWVASLRPAATTLTTGLAKPVYRGLLEEKDLEFPPGGGPEQLVFTYAETLTNITGARAIGQFTITIDHRNQKKNGVIAVTVVGSLAAESMARRILYVELDVSGTFLTNPQFFTFLSFEDRGGL
jgi:hypothetical protein